MFMWEIVTLPIIGGLIGWLTNMIAIKMLFWPKLPWRVPLVAWEFQGLLPKRKRDLARSVAQAVDEELLPIDEVLARLEETGYQRHLVVAIVRHVDDRLKDALPRIIPDNLRMIIRDFLGEVIAKEAHHLVGQVAHSTMDKFRDEARFGEFVEEKINSLDFEELEALVFRLARKELRHIELLGLLLGFTIGLVQSTFLYWRLQIGS